ncbi:MAG: hypothetical protein M1821_004993 [Bathelium mastoideum]|nr:MAG: hypothetical protein M1821_004993 [Bathelium mastoideum]KAI9688960.1 MAG: hypothetical protein M1822_000697 [Bathelium mastoideum]
MDNNSQTTRRHSTEKVETPEENAVRYAFSEEVHDHFDGPKNELPFNVDGRGGTQRRLRSYQMIMIGFCSGIGTGFLSAFINASFSFIGVETVVITAAEFVDPHRAVTRAARRVTYRIAFFYTVGALFIGMIVHLRNPALVPRSGNANSSPCVVAIKEFGITALPSIANACILISAWSAGNSYCWVSSRTVVAMTTDRQLPQVFGRVTKKDVLYVAVTTV